RVHELPRERGRWRASRRATDLVMVGSNQPDRHVLAAAPSGARKQTATRFPAPPPRSEAWTSRAWTPNRDVFAICPAERRIGSAGQSLQGPTKSRSHLTGLWPARGPTTRPALDLGFLT